MQPRRRRCPSVRRCSGPGPSRNGFLLLDEAENGILHSRQADFRKMVLQTAQQHNVQVLATTHS